MAVPAVSVRPAPAAAACSQATAGRVSPARRRRCRRRRRSTSTPAGRGRRPDLRPGSRTGRARTRAAASARSQRPAAEAERSFRTKLDGNIQTGLSGVYDVCLVSRMLCVRHRRTCTV